VRPPVSAEESKSDFVAVSINVADAPSFVRPIADGRVLRGEGQSGAHTR
jgi:hypothetical protein